MCMSNYDLPSVILAKKIDPAASGESLGLYQGNPGLPAGYSGGLEPQGSLKVIDILMSPILNAGYPVLLGER